MENPVGPVRIPGAVDPTARGEVVEQRLTGAVILTCPLSSALANYRGGDLPIRAPPS
jgi:hypothetical protein